MVWRFLTTKWLFFVCVTTDDNDHLLSGDRVGISGVAKVSAVLEPHNDNYKADACCVTGGIVVGKTNMDQFAAGLVGTRTPFGTARNAFDDRFIPGGSSSGSAVLVGAGLVSFALGTDTAGSGAFATAGAEREASQQYGPA